MELLLDPITINSRKVLAGCKLVGADYSIKKIDFFSAEYQSEEYTKINPNLVRWMTENIEKSQWWIDTHVGEGFTLPE